MPPPEGVPPVPVLGAAPPPPLELVPSVPVVSVELSADGALGTAGAAGGIVEVLPLVLPPPPPLEAMAITTIRKRMAQPIATRRRRQYTDCIDVRR